MTRVPTSSPTPWMKLLPDASGPAPACETPERIDPADLAPEALVPVESLTRRSFLAAAGLGASTVALSACGRRNVEEAIPYLVPPEELTPGVSVHYASTCSVCPAGCGLLVTARDGRPIKLEGHPGHPRSKGGLCAVGQADLRALYDAGRLRAPRSGGADASWADVDAAVANGLEAARAAAGGVYLVSKTITSPTARALIHHFLEPLGGTHVEYDAMSLSAALDAAARLGAAPMAVDLGSADLLVCLGADLLTSGPDPVAHARQWGERRGAGGARGRLRHVQFEGSLTLTGAAADERHQVGAAGERLVALWLLALVADKVKGDLGASLSAELGALPPPPVPKESLASLADALVAHGERAQVVSGADDPLEQAAVHLLGTLLGSAGAGARPVSALRHGKDAELRKALDAIGAGRAKAVFFLDCDPIDDLPDGEALAKALASVPLTVAITSRPTATAKACRIVAAMHHGLECWNDFAPSSDVLTLAQPAVRPLFGTRHPLENLLAWTGSTSSYLEHLRLSWKVRVHPTVPSARPFEAFWEAAVSTAMAPPGARFDAPAVAAQGAPEAFGEPAAVLRELRKNAGDLAASPDALEVELVADPAIGDGARAFVPWLRELPDPLTRVAWEPCVRLAPARARALGVHDGDVLVVEVGQARVELAARVLPGQSPNVLSVPVGHGRLDGDAGGAARNGYRLARWDKGSLRRRGLPAKASSAGRSVTLPLMQVESDSRGRPIVHQVSRPDEAVPPDHVKRATLWGDRPQSAPQWHMVIDLDRCTGCSACVVACQAENNIPVVGPEEMARQRDMYWLRIDRYFAGSPDAPDVLFEPMLCAQCANAPCETVCPVAATVHSHDGLNMQVYNRCVGTRYCANNCPYKVRRFNWFAHPVSEPVERLVLNPDVVVRDRGVMEKCTFCAQRIQAARLAAKTEGGPVAPQTACEQSCPTRAIHFGDGTKTDGPIAAARKEPRAFQVLSDLGVRPSVTYLARVRPNGGKGAHG